MSGKLLSHWPCKSRSENALSQSFRGSHSAQLAAWRGKMLWVRRMVRRAESVSQEQKKKDNEASGAEQEG